MMSALARRRPPRELHDFSEVFAAMTDLRETCGRVTRGIARSLGAAKCLVALHDAGARELVGQAPGYGVADPIIGAFRYRVDWPWLRAQGPMVSNRLAELHPVQWEYLRPLGVYNVAAVPLAIDGRIIGMVATADKPGGFSHRDAGWLTAIAAQAAIAVQNARLYTRLQDLAGALETKMRSRMAELEATNRELAISHARLREVDRLKSDFLGNVSHELRTPLASIRGFVDNLLDGVTGTLTPKQRHYLARMRDNADRLTRMVTDLLDLTRIEAGRLEMTLTLVDLAAVATEAAESLAPLARERGVDLDVAVASCLTVPGDVDKLRQVIDNLVSNAIKFTPRGGRVCVGAGPASPGFARLSVSDTGPGISPEDRERVFDKFYRCPRADGERPAGSGLGLAIARHLVELHGGRVWIEAAAEGGAAFVVLLPVAAEATP